MKSSLDDLKATLETIRQEKHPEIPSWVIDRIVEAQAENQDAPNKRLSATEKIIDEYVRSLSATEGGSQ